MSKTKTVYQGLFDEFFRSFTIMPIAVSGAIIDFWCKQPLIFHPATKKTAEQKFKESIFADPTQTKKTMDANPDLAEKIAEFAHADCSQLITKVTQKQKKSDILFPRLS